jgi:hypothetical protein
MGEFERPLANLERDDISALRRPAQAAQLGSERQANQAERAQQYIR